MKILQLTSYPTKAPLHGGQIRCFHIANQLRSAGHEVLTIAVFVSSDYPEYDNHDLPIDEKSDEWKNSNKEFADYFSGCQALTDSKISINLKKIGQDFKPSVVIVEQPWLFRAAYEYFHAQSKLVYSSQNIEWRLKQKIVNEALNLQIINHIKNDEEFAIINSDLTIACTESDADYYDALKEKIGFKSPTIVAGNGVEPFRIEQPSVDYWRNFFSIPYPIFVGSAHPPNVKGFWDMMSPGLTFLKPWEQIMILGGVSNIILTDLRVAGFDILNKSRLHLLGNRNKGELQAIVSAAHCIILPITTGEGSNLKTAEALESGLPIIATSKSFRGYESAMHLSHVTIADTSQDFRRAIRRQLDSPQYMAGTPVNIRSKFYWSNQLKDLVGAIEDI